MPMPSLIHHYSPVAGVPAATVRKEWLEPSLTRHASLTALTQQTLVMDPRTGELTNSDMLAIQIPCSQGFCP